MAPGNRGGRSDLHAPFLEYLMDIGPRLFHLSVQMGRVMDLEKRILLAPILSVLLCVVACSSHFELPDGNLARKFFVETAVSATPVYGIMKNVSDHVATVHGFLDNAQICSELIEVLNKPELRLFTCLKLHDGVLELK